MQDGQPHDTTTPVITPKPEQKQRPHHESHGDGMREMARQNEQAHLSPAPGATDQEPSPFPPILYWGLGLGAIIGLFAGIVFAWLLISRTLVIPGWEQLYSMAPGTFYTFWAGIGLALGLLIGGAGTVLAAPAPSKEDDSQHAQS